MARKQRQYLEYLGSTYPPKSLYAIKTFHAWDAAEVFRAPKHEELDISQLETRLRRHPFAQPDPLFLFALAVLKQTYS